MIANAIKKFRIKESDRVRAALFAQSIAHANSNEILVKFLFLSLGTVVASASLLSLLRVKFAKNRVLNGAAVSQRLFHGIHGVLCWFHFGFGWKKKQTMNLCSHTSIWIRNTGISVKLVFHCNFNVIHGFIVVVYAMTIDLKNDNNPSGDEHVKCKSSFDKKRGKTHNSKIIMSYSIRVQINCCRLRTIEYLLKSKRIHPCYSIACWRHRPFVANACFLHIHLAIAANYGVPTFESPFPSRFD